MSLNTFQIGGKFAKKINPRIIEELSEIDPPWGNVGYVVYKRTYARMIPEFGRTEDWHETVERCMNGILEIGGRFTIEEIEKLSYYTYMFKGSMAGRPTWQLGTDTVRRIGGDSLMNCWFCSIDEPIEPFCFAFNELMMGGGVGFGIMPESVYGLPTVRNRITVERTDSFDCDYIVTDNREGWVELLRRVLTQFFYGGRDIRYNTLCVRDKGRPIKGFGGIASGPEELVHGIGLISGILHNAFGRKLRPTECMYIMNIIGMIVVAGNVRRSAEIAIGDYNDTEYLQAKNWSIKNVPSWTQMSNNTVQCNDTALLPDCFWDGYSGRGEPYGLFNLDLCRQYGRLIDGVGYRPDLLVEGVNPCAEISLESYESCNLSEIFLPNIVDVGEFASVAELLFKANKAISCLPCIHPRTNDVIARNHRIGVGITGFLQATHLHDVEYFNAVYDHLETVDEKISGDMKVGQSIKLTTIKPSGCGRRDTLVATDQGLLRLDEIGSINGEQWQDINGLQAINIDSNNQITKFYVNGFVATKKITTLDGVELENSLNHRYQVMDYQHRITWRYVNDLKVGDNLVSKFGTHPENIQTQLKYIGQSYTNTQIMKQPTTLTTDIAYFLGLFYGDGSVHEKGIRIHFNRKHPGLIYWLINFFKGTFELDYTIEDDSFYVNSQNLLSWLQINGISKEFCEDINVPRLVRTSSKENAQAFITGFWRADGGIHNSGNSWSTCSVSETFARQLQQLCHSVGFNVSLSNAGPGGYGAKDRWILLNRTVDYTKARYLSRKFKERRVKGFWLDPIVKIEDSQCETYDIEVSKEHYYLGNGKVSHNTMSLLAGVTPGCHAAYSLFYIRRITFAANDPLVQIARANGYHIEPKINIDGSRDFGTMIVDFPTATPEGTQCASGYSAIQQLENQKFLQTYWADNSVSMTCYFRPEEIHEIRLWLGENYPHSMKTGSFLLHSDHGFIQAPYEEITEGQYNDLASKVIPITSVVDNEQFSLEDGVECSSGGCPIK